MNKRQEVKQLRKEFDSWMKKERKPAYYLTGALCALMVAGATWMGLDAWFGRHDQMLISLVLVLASAYGIMAISASAFEEFTVEKMGKVEP